MHVEYEATFPNINKEEMRARLKELDATLARSECLFKRTTFNLPKNFDNSQSWLRVRDEGDKITMSFKRVDGEKMINQKEINLVIDDYNSAVELLNIIGCVEKSYQETKRELWIIGETEITIDEWPYLEPLLEIEGKNEADVKNVSGMLGLDYNKALFCSVTTIYRNKYHVSDDIINNHIPRITFEEENPFLKI